MKHNVLYTATNVTCGWAGTVIRKANPRIWAGAVTQKPPVNAKKAKCYRQMEQPMERASYRVACTWGGTQ